MFSKWLVRFFDSLNTFKTVVVVLTLTLTVNGFLLYSQAPAPVAPPSPVADTTPAPPEAAVPPEKPEETTPDSPAVSETAVTEPPIIEGLEEDIRGCDGDREECTREFVAGANPGARYVGGRVDLNTDGLGRNEEVLYFEAPALGPCEHARQEYEVNDRLVYTVIIVGRGSFDSERGSECIPAS